jgi:virulence factor
MDKVRVAFIGAGSLATEMHYPSLVDLRDEVEIVAACDRDAEKAGRAAQQFGIARTFTDYRRMLDETRPDAVYAVMPPHVLFDVAMDVLERGHHLFVEKPPAVTTHQAQALARLAESRGLVTAVGFQRRYHPLVRACWEEVQKHGALHQLVACFYKSFAPQAVHPYYRGAIDILRSDAIHAVDALRYYGGLAEVQAVASEVRCLDCWYAVSFNALVTFATGAVGVLLANWRTGKRTLKFEFHAAGASAFVDADGIGEVWSDNRPTPDLRTTHIEVAGSSAAHVAQGFLAENRAFIRAVREGRPLHNDLRDALRTMELADAIYAAAIHTQTNPKP